MPRANRYFVSGYVWHITLPKQRRVPIVPVVQPLRSVQNVSDRSWLQSQASGSAGKQTERMRCASPVKLTRRNLTGENQALSSENTVSWQEATASGRTQPTACPPLLP